MELTIQIMLLGQSNLYTGPLLRVPNAITIMLTNITLSYGSTSRMHEYSILAVADGVRDREGSH
jgi:hypothetical protein